MLNKNLSRIQRRSLQLFSSSILFTAFLHIVVRELTHHTHLHPLVGPFAWLIAAISALPFLVTLLLALRYLAHERDEFIRTQVLFALLYGSFITVAVSVLYTELQNYVDIPAPPAMAFIDLFLVACMFALRFRLRSQS